MITIGNPYIEKKDKFSILNCKVEVSNSSVRGVIWFKVSDKYEKYLTTERSDA